MGRTAYDSAVAGRPTVVIVDQWALVRLGMGTVARGADLRVVGEEERASDGVLSARTEQADLVVVGRVSDMAVADAVRDAKRLDPPPAVLVLVEHPDRDELAGLFIAGADGVILRSAEGSDVASAISRVLAGERVISPELLPALVGMVGTEGSGNGDSLHHVAAGDDAGLTIREREVLRALAGGRTNREIAERLFVTEATVKTHLANLYSKLGANDRHAAVARAMSLGLLD